MLRNRSIRRLPPLFARPGITSFPPYWNWPIISITTRTPYRKRFAELALSIKPEYFQHEAASSSGLATDLDGWVVDLLTLMGTVPMESSDIAQRALTRVIQRISGAKPDEERHFSAQCRNEAMLCLEMLCTKIWYSRHREKLDPVRLQVEVYQALQHLYWNCGLPKALPMFYGSDVDNMDSVYASIRKTTYRHLYALDEAGLVSALLSRVHDGSRALYERRRHFQSRFALSLRRDPRWTRPLTEQNALVIAKYAALDAAEVAGENGAAEPALVPETDDVTHF